MDNLKELSIEILTMNEKYAFVKTASRQIDVLSTKNFKKVMTLKTGQCKCLLILEQTLFVGCWGKVLEVYRDELKTKITVKTQNDIRNMIVFNFKHDNKSAIICGQNEGCLDFIDPVSLQNIHS